MKTTVDNKTIVEKLIQYQKDHNLNDTEMANTIHIKSYYWNHLCAGRRQPGPMFYGGVLVGLPKFKNDVILDLKSRLTSTEHSGDNGGQKGKGLRVGFQGSRNSLATNGGTSRNEYFRTERISKRSKEKLTSAEQEKAKGDVSNG
jgi:hypothetical protein